MPIVKKQGAVARVGGQESRDAWDTASDIRMLIYGNSGTGKTTLWSAFPGPILALMGSGGNRPGELKSIDTPENSKKIKARVIESVDQIKGYLAEAEDGGYKTVVIDHGSGLQDLTLKEILGLDQLPAQKGWGMATKQQYGQSTLQCKEVFRAALNLPCHVVIVAQERSFGDESASDVIQATVGAAMTPSLTGWLNPAVDYVVQTFIRPKIIVKENQVGGKVVRTQQRGQGVEYCLRCEPHEIFQTKFRVAHRNLPSVIIDPSFDKINRIINGK